MEIVFAVFLLTLMRMGLRNPIILVVNAKPHYHSSVREYLERSGLEALQHPAYSPDMNPFHFDIFRRIKRALKGRRFRNVPTLVSAVMYRIDELNESHVVISRG